MRRAPIITATASFAVGLVAVVALITSAVAPVAGAGTTSSSSVGGGTTGTTSGSGGSTSSTSGPITTVTIVDTTTSTTGATTTTTGPTTTVAPTTTTTTLPPCVPGVITPGVRCPQKITWVTPKPTDAIHVGDTFQAQATSDSGLDVTVTVTQNCTGQGVTNNSKTIPVKANAEGACTLTASQAGDSNWLPAQDAVIQVVVIPPLNPTPGEYVPVTPKRILETRTDDGGGSAGCAPNCQTANWKGKPEPADNEVVRLKVNDLTFDSPSDLAVATDASAVVVNVTAVTPTNTGFVTVYNCDDPRPTASSINLEPGGTAFSAAPNAVIANVSATGEICIYTKSSTHLVVDIAGWFPKISTFKSRSPVRVFETRNNGADVPINYTGTGLLAANTVFHVPLKDASGSTMVPAGSKAVAVNVTALDATADGDLRVWDCKGPAPSSRNLTLATGRTVPNLVLASMDPDNKTTSEICVQTTTAANLAIDVQGYFPSEARYTPLPGGAQALLSNVSIGQQGIVPFEVKNQAGIGTDATAVVLTVTGVNPDIFGFVTVWPDPTGACSAASRPRASQLNLAPTRTATNLVIAKLAAESTKLCIFSQAATTLTVNAFGFFTGVVKAA